jgi:hypothetical protein
VIAGAAIPVLVYIAVTTEQDVERLAMLSMITITVAAVVFGWWNRRGVLRSSATTVAEYVAISAERLRRMRAALTIGWLMLAAEVVIFSIWSWNRLYSGPAPPDAGVERFMWLWLAGLTLAAMIGLLYCGRWLTRDTARFESLRRELERN